jgi:hypothetical protein
MTEPVGALVPDGEPDEPPSGSGSPLRRLRDQVRAYPRPPDGDPRRRALFYGALGSGTSLVGAGVATALPPGSSIRSSGFYILGKVLTAGLVDGLAALAGPLAIIGILLLLATLVVYLRKEEGEAADWLLTAEPVVGLGALGLSACGWAALVILIVINLVIWATIIAVLAVVGFGLLAGLAAGFDG